jgi:hypothetical protein
MNIFLKVLQLTYHELNLYYSTFKYLNYADIVGTFESILFQKFSGL